MNTERSSEVRMVHDMLQEHNKMDPIVIDRDILRDADANSRVKVHPCNWNGCDMHVGVEHKQVAKHLQQHHGINASATSKETKEIVCLWKGCLDSHTKPGNLTRHILKHIGVRHICLTCQRSFSREDAFRRHTTEKECCQDAEVAVSYGAEVRAIDTLCMDSGWSISQNVMCIPL
ncbi:hypothetical protein DEU56DRAFT_483113 [Suillus clintonianus]|uniref:uncharacterized protein n=1 Tax=Suillus clintonianus TaxID=1904413 RepID=UPI001B8650BE|nr:uncharacterized protein DEU56DRAFT_483113 [Suillus clintonianus]KAG2153384.1 hypothetical protein DEU56DRAFT_483113 [Suillus clintonianus]